MEHTMNTENSPTKENKFIQNNIRSSLTIVPFIGTREVRVKRCNDDRRCSYGQLQHVFVDHFMALQ